jgi:uncharacterized repeat protein (TIGR03803 family)
MRIGQTAAAWLACALAAIGTSQAQAATETVIHAFANFPHGANPYAPLTRDAAGNLYGTTYQGGQANLGVVFKLDASGKQTVLHSFTGGADGASPYAGVTRESAGNLYGTTYRGGAANAGVAYKVSPSGQETVLYAFTGGADGGSQYAGVILDSSGNLYGTTYGGGVTNCSGGCGVVYKVDPSGQETVLYSFTGGADGANPYAGVIADEAGNLYGTAYRGGVLTGGCFPGGCGVVFRLNPSGQETPLYSFVNPGPGGAEPYSGVIRDGDGNLYGTTSAGAGVVYKLDTAGNYTVLRAFAGGTRPQKPEGGLVRDAAGNLYGTTQRGETADAGAVFKLNTAGTETVLYSFKGGARGKEPYAGLLRESAGNLFGTPSAKGAYGCGVVFKLAP